MAAPKYPAILFLDFDGVMISVTSVCYWQRKLRGTGEPDDLHFDPMAIENLKLLLDAMPELQIVLHSTRRDELAEPFAVELGEYASRVVGQTPLGLSKTVEINRWLQENSTEMYVVLEDHPILDVNNTLYVDQRVGLTFDDVYTVLEKFGKQTGKEYWRELPLVVL